MTEKNFGKLTARAAATIHAAHYLNPQWETTPEKGEDDVPVDEQNENEE